MSTIKTPAELETVDRLVAIANACTTRSIDPMADSFGPIPVIRRNALHAAAEIMGIAPEQEGTKEMSEETLRREFNGRCGTCDRIIPECTCGTGLLPPADVTLDMLTDTYPEGEE